MTDINGFHYVQQVSDLDTAFSEMPPVSSDVFIQALISVDDEIMRERIGMVPGEEFKPDFIRIGRDGKMQFWFRPTDPAHEHRAARFGLTLGDLADAFPDLSMPLTPNALARLDHDNALAIGQRIKVIGVINEALDTRRFADAEEEIIRVENEKAAQYEADKDSGIF